MRSNSACSAFTSGAVYSTNSKPSVPIGLSHRSVIGCSLCRIRRIVSYETIYGSRLRLGLRLVEVPGAGDVRGRIGALDAVALERGRENHAHGDRLARKRRGLPAHGPQRLGHVLIEGEIVAAREHRDLLRAAVGVHV